jgi:hypothetical protein
VVVKYETPITSGSVHLFYLFTLQNSSSMIFLLTEAVHFSLCLFIIFKYSGYEFYVH